MLFRSVNTEVVQDGETVTQEVTYPMLSQRMGFHYGANFQMPDFGEYVARVNFEGLGSTRGVGALDGKYGESATIEIPFEWSEGALFYLPRATPFRHLNMSPDDRALLISSTPLPLQFFLNKDEQFIFDPGYQDRKIFSYQRSRTSCAWPQLPIFARTSAGVLNQE
mgnify:CR=1 FL=1